MTDKLTAFEYAELYGSTDGYAAYLAVVKQDDVRRGNTMRRSMHERKGWPKGRPRKTVRDPRKDEATLARKAAIQQEIDALLAKGRALREQEETKRLQRLKGE